MRGAPLIALAIAACGSGSPEARFALETQPRQSLVGAWDAKLSLVRPYQLELHQPATKWICGTIGFVDNHYARGRSDLSGNSPHLGVYDLNLSLLGLNWLDNNSFPTAVDVYTPAASSAHDSVAIVLNPSSQERIVLRGRYDGQGISGGWIAQSPRGTASGLFSMKPHAAAQDQSPRCSEFD